MVIYGHPFASYHQKALIALYEHAIAFEFRMLGGDERTAAEHAKLWPLKRMPVLADGDRTLVEASIIIEYIDTRYPGSTRLIPEGTDEALEARMMDRIFDNYVMTPMQRIVSEHLRPAEQRDPHGVAEAHALLDTAYGWLEQTLPGRTWACGASFTLADCAAAPALFYADWVHPIGDARPTLLAYRRRLLSRPSFSRVVDEARPYRPLFPPGAPDRD